MSVATLQRISREQLSDLLLSGDVSKVAVIDVRDNDHVGGHIYRSTHVPSSELEHRIPEILRTLHDKEIVVFHCALSQQRGPSAALRYMRAKETNINNGEYIRACGSPETGIRDGEVKKVPTAGKEQKVYVLDRGFVGWQEKYEPTIANQSWLPQHSTNILLQIWQG